MINAAVLGSPIAHSLSPKIHRKALEILGIAGNYEAFEVGESEFSGFLSKHSATNWSGFSLTMPLKESVFGLIPNIDETTRRINSANTIYWCFCPNANEYIEKKQPNYTLFKNEKCTIGTDSYASNWSLSILDELKTISKSSPKIDLETWKHYLL